MSDYRQSESCDGELMFLDRQFDRYAADHAGQLPERCALAAEDYDRLLAEQGWSSPVIYRGVSLTRIDSTRPAVVPPTHPPSPAAPTEVVLRDRVVESACRLERARTAISTTFHMRDFWTAVKEVSDAVDALNRHLSSLGGPPDNACVTAPSGIHGAV